LARRRSVPAGNGGERRRLRAPRADLVGVEVEGGEAELLGASEELGAAQNGGAQRRPRLGFRGRAREERLRARGRKGERKTTAGGFLIPSRERRR
jgi:hypothetical protein